MNNVATNETYTTWQRLVSLIALFSFVFVFYAPTAHAAYESIKNQNELPVNSLEYINPFGKELEQLQSQIQELEGVLQAASAGSPDDIDRLTNRIQEQSDVLRMLDINIREEIDATTTHLLGADVSDEVVARNEAFLDNYDHHISEIFRQTELLLEWDQKQGVDVLIPILAGLKDHLKYSTRNPQQSFSGDLDFIDPPPRNIYTNKTQIQSLLGVDDSTAWPMSAYLQTDSATKSTARIEALVNQIGSDPVNLYNWVHDNLHYIPSYGVMQGADYTLQTEQGNAFDIASTLIAMYRQVGIHARYVYGTVALPSESVQNWVGGVSNVDAATNLLSQGGIPQRQLSYGGAIEEVEMEHVWVEAYVNGEWVGMDPSFKQYTYTEGMELKSQVKFDGEILFDQLNGSVIRDDSEGWIQKGGMDFQSEIIKYQENIQGVIDSQNPNATVSEIIGSQVIVPTNLVSTNEIALPYEKVLIQESAPNLPSGLYYKFKLQLGSAYGGSFGIPIGWGGAIAEVDELTTELVGKPISVSFRPASTADMQILESYASGATSIENLTKQLPANTVRMIGEILVGKDVVATTGEVFLGDALMMRLGYQLPQKSWVYSENDLVAGQYQAVGIDLQGMSPYQLESLMATMEQTKSLLQSGDTSALTHHELVGDILHVGIQSYLAETYAMDRISAQSSGLVYYRSPSYGTFSTSLNVSYLFGMPRSVHIGGMVMDVDRMSANTESKDNCYEDWLAFNKSSGMRNSAYEHLIPERLFSSETRIVQGVSTAKMLSLAMSSGQRIYELTSANAAQLSNISIDAAARSEIQSALQKGLVVTVHQSPININGWEGSGYMVIDPEYGIGAYKISGGENGGFISDDVAGFLTWIGFSLGLVGALFAVTLLIAISAAITIALAADLYLDYAGINSQCTGLGAIIAIAIVFAILSIFVPVGGMVIASYVSLIAGGAAMAAAGSAICN